ncbi:MAG: putative ABC transporter permease subunit, partial [Candidatus Binatia bacterium]
LQTSPIPLRSLLWSKFWLNFLPLLFFGELLVFFSNILLDVPQWMMGLSLVTIFLMTFGITAIGVGVGAIYPKFDYDHAAEIPTSFGGAICMVLSVAFVGGAVILEAWPAYWLAMEEINTGAVETGHLWVIAPSLAAVSVLTTVAVIIPLRSGLKKLERMKD